VRAACAAASATHGDAVIAAIVLQALAAVIAWLLAARVAGTASRLLVGASTYVLTVHTAVLAAGLIGHLEPAFVAVMLFAALVGTVWRSGERRERVRTAGGEAHVPGIVALGALTLWMTPHVTGATRLWIWDDYTYHMVYPALWLREHAIVPVPPAHAFTMQAWYPLSASVVSAWFMLPFAPARGDTLAWVSVTAVVYGIIVAAAIGETLRRAGAPGAWALPVVLFATSTRMQVMASTFSDADLAQAAMVFAALAFAIPRHEPETSRELWIDAAYAALLSGLAIGVKVSAVPAACVVLALVTWRAAALGSHGRAVLRVGFLFGSAWLATGGYWYLRNWMAAGNPLYPAAFLGWPGSTFPHTTLREYAAHWGLVRAVRDAVPVYAGWPLVHAALALAGLVALVVWRPANDRRRTNAARAFTVGALAITVITLLALPTMPFSAGNGMTFLTGIVHWDSMRYVALLPLLGWTALAIVIAALRRWVRLPLVTALMIAGGWASGVSLGAWAGATAMAAAVATAWWGLRRFVPRMSGAVALAAALGLFAWLHAGKAAETGASIYREPLFGRAAAVIDRAAPGTRIAIYGDQWTYPAFGDRHHLVPIRVDPDGRVATTPIGDGMTPGPLTVDAPTLRANLRASGIGLVAVVHLPHPGRSPEWPTQAAALDRMDGVRSIYRDGAVGLWRMEDP
jgi:hypothetical protein